MIKIIKMSRLVRRLARELEECQKLKEETGIIVEPTNEADLTEWTAYLPGPEDSPYYGYIYPLSIQIPDNFPMRPPLINFKIKVYHPNVGSGGSICLDILGEQWSPVLTLPKIILSISSLLTDPNPKSPLNSSAGRKYQVDYESFCEEVKSFALKYAQPI